MMNSRDTNSLQLKGFSTTTLVVPIVYVRVFELLLDFSSEKEGRLLGRFCFPFSFGIFNRIIDFYLFTKMD